MAAATKEAVMTAALDKLTYDEKETLASFGADTLFHAIIASLAMTNQSDDDSESSSTASPAPAGESKTSNTKSKKPKSKKPKKPKWQTVKNKKKKGQKSTSGQDGVYPPLVFHGSDIEDADMFALNVCPVNKKGKANPGYYFLAFCYSNGEKHYCTLQCIPKKEAGGSGDRRSPQNDTPWTSLSNGHQLEMTWMGQYTMQPWKKERDGNPSFHHSEIPPDNDTKTETFVEFKGRVSEIVASLFRNAKEADGQNKTNTQIQGQLTGDNLTI